MLYRPLFFPVFFVFKGPFAFVNGQTSSSMFIKTPCSFECVVSLLSLSLMPFGAFGSGGGEIWYPGYVCFLRFPAYFCLKRRSSLRSGEEIGGRGYVWGVCKG